MNINHVKFAFELSTIHAFVQHSDVFTRCSPLKKSSGLWQEYMYIQISHKKENKHGISLTVSRGAEQFVDVVQGERGLVTARALEQREGEVSRAMLAKLPHRWQT